MKSTSKLTAVFAAAALTVGGLAATTPAAADAEAAAAKASTKRFNFAASAYGSRVFNKNGDLVDSGRTAWSLVACTSKTGKTNRGRVAEANLPGNQLKVGPIKTKARSIKTKKGVKSQATTTVGDIVLKGPGVGSLKIEGLKGISESSHSNGKYRQKGSVDLLNIKAVLGGIEVDLPFNPDNINPGQEFRIPGLAKLRFLDTKGKATAGSAHNSSVALEIKVLADGPLEGQTVRVGSATTHLRGVSRKGKVHGYGQAARADVLDSVVNSGRIAHERLNCTGTNGKWQRNTVAGVNVTGLPVRVGAASGQARGILERGRKPVAHTRARIANVKLTNALKIGAVRSWARVAKKNGKYQRRSGVSVLRVRAGGENITRQVNRAIKNQKSITIPGVVKITPNVVKRQKRAISVTALRIRLLDVAKPLRSTIHLANSKARVK